MERFENIDLSRGAIPIENIFFFFFGRVKRDCKSRRVRIRVSK